MEARPPNLLEEAVGLEKGSEEWALRGKTVTIWDRVETSGSFVLHQLIKRALLSRNADVLVILLSFAHPLSHYDRVLRKLGCNLIAQRDNRRFVFFDLLTLDFSDRNGEGCLASLFRMIQKAARVLPENEEKHVTIFIDDVSLMEVAAGGSTDSVLDFLHYCHTLTADNGCSLVMLNHEDIYSSMERPTLQLQVDYLADVSIKVEPLFTGLAADVHGQLTVLNREGMHGKGTVENKVRNFHFRVKENIVEYFYPGGRT